MADGFIVRKGGVTTEQATMPTILNITEDGNKISFEIKNNDTQTAVILFEVDDTTPDANSLELASNATSDTITITGLDELETYIVFATANVTGKVKSEVASQSITTSAITFTAATGGTTLEYDDGGKRYKSHTFTSDGTFTVTTVGDATGDRNKADYLIIAGGASGGYYYAGGGGAGGYRTTLGTSGGDTSARDKVTVTAQGYSVFVGAGGVAQGTCCRAGNNGINSSALGVTSNGGGGGAGSDSNQAAKIGGSGGGGNYSNRTGAAGTLDEGFAGGSLSANHGGGGGGGAAEAGQNTTSTNGGKGGDGLANLLRTGSNETRAGGGGGSSFGAATFGTGGVGGGGNGGTTSNTFSVASGKDGTINTGSGGGGNGANAAGSSFGVSGAGGSGIVVIRYEIAPSV